LRTKEAEARSRSVTLQSEYNIKLTESKNRTEYYKNENQELEARYHQQEDEIEDLKKQFANLCESKDNQWMEHPNQVIIRQIVESELNKHDTAIIEVMKMRVKSEEHLRNLGSKVQNSLLLERIEIKIRKQQLSKKLRKIDTESDETSEQQELKKQLKRGETDCARRIVAVDGRLKQATKEHKSRSLEVKKHSEAVTNERCQRMWKLIAIAKAYGVNTPSAWEDGIMNEEEDEHSDEKPMDMFLRTVLSKEAEDKYDSWGRWAW
jgi:hypothetical protein